MSSHDVRAGQAVSRLRTTAWQLSGSWALTGESASYDGLTPRRPVDWKRGQWGAWEIVLRYSRLSLDPAAFPRLVDPRDSARVAGERAAGVVWHLSPYVRCLVNYAETRFTEGAPGGRRPTERGLFTRLQVAF